MSEEETRTIDNVPSCGMENDWRRAHPAPEARPAEDELIAKLDAFDVKRMMGPWFRSTKGIGSPHGLVIPDKDKQATMDFIVALENAWPILRARASSPDAERIRREALSDAVFAIQKLGIRLADAIDETHSEFGEDEAAKLGNERLRSYNEAIEAIRALSQSGRTEPR